MTLSSRIAALTGASRDLDAEIADLLGWWRERVWKVEIQEAIEVFTATGVVIQCPNYTTNIMHGFEECDKRGWFYGGTNESENLARGAEFDVWNNESEILERVQRTDRNVTLAACEALVRAVENDQP